METDSIFKIVSLAQAETPLAWYQQTVPVLGLMVAAVVLAYFIAGWITTMSRSREQHGWKVWTILSVLLIGMVVVVAKWPPRFGVDLRGGISIIGQLKQDDSGLENVNIADQIPRLLARVDPSGTQEIMIRPLGTDKIEVTIPDVEMDQAMRIWKRLASAGHLLFRIEADERYHSPLIARATQLIENGINDSIVRAAVDGNPTDNQSGEIIGKWYELARLEPGQEEQGVLPFKYVSLPTTLIRHGTTKQLIDWNQVPRDPVGLALWARENNARKIELLMVEPPSKDDPMNVEGEHIQSARSGFDSSGGPAVLFEMTREGRQRMGRLTSRNKRNGDRERHMAIISDGRVLTAPSLNGTITSSGIIEGRFTDAEVEDLKIYLNSGRLDVALAENPISQDYVESTIGEDLKRKGIFAIGLSFVIVVLFMLAYYRFAGIVACFALFSNLLLVMGAVMLIKQPLTMTGLAGLVLTVGMAVDANVLIFERIREELNKGSALRMAIRNGFDKALSAIVDSNITTILTALILYLLGSEQLKGFAVTLILGICTSMFTAIFCSRVIFEISERQRWLTQLKMLSVFPGGTVDFVGIRRAFYALSLIVIAVGMIGVYVRGEKILDNDLRGGSTARVVLADNVTYDIDQFRAKLASYTAEINGEPVEFSVSKIQSDEFPDRVFKVDSNIPVWDQPGAPAYKEIDDAIVEVFGEELLTQNVDFGNQLVERLDLESPTTPTTSGSGSNTSFPMNNGPNETPASDPVPGGNSLNWRSTLHPTAAMTGMLTMSPRQDDAGNQETENQDTENQETENQETGEPAADNPAAPTEETLEPAAGNSVDNNQDAPPAENPPITQADDEDAQIGQIGRFRVTVPMKFAQSISRRSLIDAIVSAATTADGVGLEEADVTVSAPDVQADQMLAKSYDWTVAMILPREKDAEIILDTLAKQYNGQPYFPTISGVGGQVAGQTQVQALAAVLGSLLIIIGYIWVRFQSVDFGLAAVVALVHDVLVTLGAVAVSFWLQSALGFLQVENFRISLPVLAAFLTLVGYSLNDTIVIFDRIREVRGKRTELTAEMINVSISQTMSRTILTSGTTLMVVLVLYFLGGDSIHPFAFALVIGIIAGTYSTIFIASPILLWLMNRHAGRKVLADEKA